MAYIEHNTQVALNQKKTTSDIFECHESFNQICQIFASYSFPSGACGLGLLLVGHLGGGLHTPRCGWWCDDGPYVTHTCWSRSHMTGIRRTRCLRVPNSTRISQKTASFCSTHQPFLSHTEGRRGSNQTRERLKWMKCFNNHNYTILFLLYCCYTIKLLFFQSLPFLEGLLLWHAYILRR